MRLRVELRKPADDFPNAQATAGHLFVHGAVIRIELGAQLLEIFDRCRRRAILSETRAIVTMAQPFVDGLPSRLSSVQI